MSFFQMRHSVRLAALLALAKAQPPLSSQTLEGGVGPSDFQALLASSFLGRVSNPASASANQEDVLVFSPSKGGQEEISDDAFRFSPSFPLPSPPQQLEPVSPSVPEFLTVPNNGELSLSSILAAMSADKSAGIEFVPEESFLTELPQDSSFSHRINAPRPQRPLIQPKRFQPRPAQAAAPLSNSLQLTGDLFLPPPVSNSFQPDIPESQRSSSREEQTLVRLEGLISEMKKLARQEAGPAVPGGVDFSQATRQPDGRLCVIKEESVETLSKDPILECTHKNVEKCHYTYVTVFNPQQEEQCEENFEKSCQITFRAEATRETVRKCYRPQRKVCNGQGPQQCRTEYESSCTTR